MTNTFSISIPQLPAALSVFKQAAYIVDDIDAAIEKWRTAYKVSPFIVARNESPFQNAYYRGAPSESIIVDLAFAYIGELQIELICQKNKAPSMYQEVLARGQVGLQHYGSCVKDFDQAVAYCKAHHFTPIMTAGEKGVAQMHYVEASQSTENIFHGDDKAYIKTPEGFAMVLEIIEDNAVTQPYFEGIKKRVEAVAQNQEVVEFKLAELAP